MIFVTVGSSSNGFDRLIKMVDELKGEKRIKERIVAQVGNGSYVPMNLEEYFRFVDWKRINELNKKATLIISHAGVGAIMTALRYKKPIICVPRLRVFSEHTDNHQLEIAETLRKQGKILVAMNKDDLLRCINIIKRGWRPKVSRKNNKVVEEITKFLNKLK